MYCPHCGKENRKMAVYCAFCGKAIARDISFFPSTKTKAANCLLSKKSFSDLFHNIDNANFPIIKKYALIALISVITVSVFAAFAHKNKKPSKNQIINDLQASGQFTESGNDLMNFGKSGYSIKSFDVQRSNSENGYWSADLLVRTSNSLYELERVCSVEYQKYDVGGWQCESISPEYSSEITKVLDVPSKSDAIALLQRYWYDNIVGITESGKGKSGNYSNWFVDYTFEVEESGSYLSYTIEKTVSFSLSDSLIWEGEIDDYYTVSDWSLGDLSGVWSFSTFSNLRAYFHFNEVNQNNDNINLDILTQYISKNISCHEYPAINYNINSVLHFFHEKWADDSAYIELNCTEEYLYYSYFLKGSLTSTEYEIVDFSEETGNSGPLGTIRIYPDKILCFCDTGMEAQEARRSTDRDWASDNPRFNSYNEKWINE